MTTQSCTACGRAVKAKQNDNMMSNSFTAVHLMSSENGDWHGLYINGKLVYENHDISASESILLLKGAGLPIEFTTSRMTAKMARAGQCPKVRELT
jgi:hypothetical protein